MTQTYLITGGSGFLGGHVARRLLQQGHKVKSLDILPLEEPDLLGKVEDIRADVRDESALESALQGIDVVIHAAAALPLESNRTIFSTNVDGTQNLVNLLSKKLSTKLVHISSTAVYGVPEKHPIDETDPLIGVGTYGESKIQAESILDAYRSKDGFAAVVRPKTFIGTGRLGVFQILFDWVQKGARIPIIGSGNNQYQLLEVQDLVEAILLCAQGPDNKANDIFNVGAERFKTVKSDMTALCEEAASGARVLPTPAKPVKWTLKVLEKMKLSPLYQWVYDTADKDSFVSTQKIQAQLGWLPQYSNQETLINTYKWYQNEYEDYQGKVGKTHRVAWDQGALKWVRRVLGG